MMKYKIGTFFMIIGAALVLAALSLFAWNQRESQKAADSVEQILPQMIQYLEDYAEEQRVEPLPGVTGSDVAMDTDTTMTEVEIDGYSYIGYLSIPSLELELPVMAEWDYSRLKVAPCRYSGSTKTDDLVIAAHNYARHFGGLSKLTGGEVVYFIDMDNVLSVYQVVEVDTLAPTDVKDMTAGEFDLTLFTCTYGGKSRVTVRCERVAN